MNQQLGSPGGIDRFKKRMSAKGIHGRGDAKAVLVSGNKGSTIRNDIVVVPARHWIVRESTIVARSIERVQSRGYKRSSFDQEGTIKRVQSQFDRRNKDTRAQHTRSTKRRRHQNTTHWAATGVLACAAVHRRIKLMSWELCLP